MITDLSKLVSLFPRRCARAPEDVDRLAGVVIGYTSDGRPVYWPRPTRERAAHAAVFAASGVGKTIVVTYGIVHEFLRSIAEDDSPECIVLVDPKGDSIAAILASLAMYAPEALARVAYYNPFDGGFSFNLALLARAKTPLDIRAAQLAALCAEASTARGQQRHLGVGARQLDVLEAVILGALAVPHMGACVLLALDALEGVRGLARLASITANVRARQRLTGLHLSDELHASCAARLRGAFAATDDLARIVSAPSCVQFSDIIAPGRIVLLDIAQPTGGLLSLSAAWANLVGRLAIDHLLERPSPWDGFHVRIVADEFQLIAANLADVSEVLWTTARSRGISVVALSQGTTLIHEASPSLVRVLLTNTPTKLIGRLAAPDAELLAREQAPAAGVESSRGSVRDQFISQVTNCADREFFALTPGGRQRFRSVDVDMGAWADAAKQHAAAIEAVKRRHALPPNMGPRVTLDDLAPVKQAPRRNGHRRNGARRGNGVTAPTPRAATRWG